MIQLSNRVEDTFKHIASWTNGCEVFFMFVSLIVDSEYKWSWM